MTVERIQEKIASMARWGMLYIPEFTFNDLRIDAIIIDIRHRWVRGFEIKISRQDFLADSKWQYYSSFCSSLSVVCPNGLIQPDEVKKPFGLLWADELCIWKKRPKKFNHRGSLAWLYTYLKVLELEMPRLAYENADLRLAVKEANPKLHKVVKEGHNEPSKR